MLFNKMPKLKFYPDNRNNVRWKCPGLFENDNALIMLHDLCAELHIKQPVHAVFGGITSPWSGGRIPQIDTISEKELYSIVEEYNKRNIECHFTFSNFKVKPDHLNDYIGNLVCKVLSDIKFPNNLIISSDLLSEYIKDKYPSIRQTASVIKPSYEKPLYDETADYYNDLCKRFDYVCIRPEFNTDISFLRKLKYKHKIELMVNQICFSKCPLAQIHYDKAVKYTPEDTEAGKRIRFCHKKAQDIHTIYDHLNNSSNQIDKMIKNGFYNLKLKGRGASTQSLLSEIIGRYIFEPTGYFPIIEDYILNKLKLV